MDLTALFVDVDDFYQTFRDDYEHHLLSDGTRQRHRETKLAMSEIMTILIMFQCSNTVPSSTSISICSPIIAGIFRSWCTMGASASSWTGPRCPCSRT
jgi:hypothetical protein